MFLIKFPLFVLSLQWLTFFPLNTSFELKNLKTLLFGTKASVVSHICWLVSYFLFALIFQNNCL